MLQRAGRLEGDARHSGALRNRVHGNDFAEIPGQGGNARRLLAILRVLRQQMAVLLDGHAAAARRDDDRLDAATFDHRPPGVDERAHVIAPGFLAIEVEANAAAAAGPTVCAACALRPPCGRYRPAFHTALPKDRWFRRRGT